MYLDEINWRTPLAAFAPLADEPLAVLLHAGDAAAGAEWAFVAAFPSEVIEQRNGLCLRNGAEVEDEAFRLLSRIHENRLEGLRGGDTLGPLSSGLIGYVGYDAGFSIEPRARAARKKSVDETGIGLPEISFGAYDAVAAFHLPTRRAVVQGVSANAVDRLASRLGEEATADLQAPMIKEAASNFTRAEFEAAVAEVQRRILRGDLFQANISHRIDVEFERSVSAQELARTLSKESAARFAALLQYPSGAIVSNSPERFFRISREGEERRILAEPIKGTRRRSADPVADRAAALELERDPKDRAENIMIADLARNDLSRICADHSIAEDDICRLETYAGVHHLVSRISGTLRPELNAIDALRSMFPCGSITGAPKIEAMRVIDELEPHERGPYCGAIGYVDDRGGADFSVAIRTAVLDAASTQMTFCVGGGVTLRSDPSAEYDETLAKADSAFGAIGAFSELLR